jgi:NAD(P)H dehydrogenase (quinone)
MAVNVHVIFYSTYGHTYRLAEAIAEGARTIPGANVQLLQVAETLPEEILQKMGALDARKAFAHIPLADPKRLAECDAVIIGAPTRYGSVAAQMQTFLDATGQLWAKGALIGKVGSGFTSTATQHGGQETTLMSLTTFFFHQGMVIAGVPYSSQELSHMGELTGGTPYGSSTVAGPKGDRAPSANELAIARAQGVHVTRIAAKLAAK